VASSVGAVPRCERPQDGRIVGALGKRDGFSNVPALDGLRAVAILLVAGHHTPRGKTFPFNHGWIGVDVFFTLSGHLITFLLVSERRRTGGVHFGKFYLRRFTRIVPALFASPPMTSIGRLSYSIYPLHMTAFSWYAQLRPGIEALTSSLGLAHARGLALVHVGLEIGLALACAAASHYLLERPFLRLKDRFQARALAPSAATAVGPAVPS
jgi:peptidoglycan/LPS O-acetylase OafA/YrhL